ncbi:hypothetical protein [Ohtaekwangia koreensis]|nr:hypothetical protein [Ohtaekwangia koreensis]
MKNILRTLLAFRLPDWLTVSPPRNSGMILIKVKSSNRSGLQ